MLILRRVNVVYVHVQLCSQFCSMRPTPHACTAHCCVPHCTSWPTCPSPDKLNMRCRNSCWVSWRQGIKWSRPKRMQWLWPRQFTSNTTALIKLVLLLSSSACHAVMPWVCWCPAVTLGRTLYHQLSPETQCLSNTARGALTVSCSGGGCAGRGAGQCNSQGWRLRVAQPRL